MPKRVDANQAEIVKALRNWGFSVHSLHEVGKGFPDIAVGFAGVTIIVEIKDEKGKLNKTQLEWHERWNGQKLVAYSAREVVIGFHDYVEYVMLAGHMIMNGLEKELGYE